jgi:hypothetical protein
MMHSKAVQRLRPNRVNDDLMPVHIWNLWLALGLQGIRSRKYRMQFLLDRTEHTSPLPMTSRALLDKITC